MFVFALVKEIKAIRSQAKGKYERKKFDPPKLLEEEPRHCGVEKDCGVDSFPVRLFTGVQNHEVIRICVDGK